jgi:hypothetical protein
MRPIRAAVAAAFLACFPVAASAAGGERAVAVTASRIVNFRLGSAETRFGALEFVGGLALSSKDKDFGGLSGVRVTADRSAFLAVSDEGQWFAGKLQRDGGGALSGVHDVLAGPLGPERGKLPPAKREIDCEAIAIAGDTAFLAYERNHRIERVPLAGDRPAGRTQPHFVKAKRLGLAFNKGMEALAVFPAGSPDAGSLLAIAEESLDGQGNSRAFVVSAAGVKEFSIARSDDFSPTDADFLPGGDLLLLERHFSLKRGPLMRIRRIGASELAAGSLAQGMVLLEADATYRIDNMEGLAVSKSPDGAVFVDILSDDNFSALQSTLLLEFRLSE